MFRRFQGHVCMNDGNPMWTRSRTCGPIGFPYLWEEKAVVNRMNPTSWDATSTRVFPRCDRSPLLHQSAVRKLFEINPCRDAGIPADRARARRDWNVAAPLDPPRVVEGIKHPISSCGTGPVSARDYLERRSEAGKGKDAKFKIGN